MSYYVIITVGNRDVKLKNIDDNYKEIKSPYYDGEKIFNNWETYKEKIHLPLISPFIERVNNELQYKLKVNKRFKDCVVFLIVTDQRDIDENFKNKDTIFFGKIIKRYLNEKQKIPETKINLVILEQLSTLYLMKIFKKEIEKKIKPDKKRIFAEISGGIPFVNYLLLFKFSFIYREKFSVLHINEKDNSAKNMELVEHIISYFRKESLKGLIKNYQYFAAKEFVLSNNDELNIILDFLNAWKNMDLKKAEFFKKLIIEKNRNSNLSKIIDFFNYPSSKSEYILYLFYNIELKIKTGEYVDLLSRLYSLRENILVVLLNLFLGYPLENIDYIKSHKTFLDNNTEIVDFLKKIKIRDESLKYLEPNKLVYLEMLSFAAKSDKNAKKALKILEKFNKILEYRNKTIVGHEFKGCSKEKITELYSTNNIEDIIKDLIELFTIAKIIVQENEISNPFNMANEILIKGIENINRG